MGISRAAERQGIGQGGRQFENSRAARPGLQQGLGVKPNRNETYGFVPFGNPFFPSFPGASMNVESRRPNPISGHQTPAPRAATRTVGTGLDCRISVKWPRLLLNPRCERFNRPIRPFAVNLDKIV